jgi:transcriptional regulator with XRE-family HTH domain
MATGSPTLLRHLRRARELTLMDVAAKTGVHYTTLSHIERGIVKPSEPTRSPATSAARLAGCSRLPESRPKLVSAPALTDDKPAPPTYHVGEAEVCRLKHGCYLIARGAVCGQICHAWIIAQ